MKYLWALTGSTHAFQYCYFVHRHAVHNDFQYLSVATFEARNKFKQSSCADPQHFTKAAYYNKSARSDSKEYYNQQTSYDWTTNNGNSESTSIAKTTNNDSGKAKHNTTARSNRSATNICGRKTTNKNKSNSIRCSKPYATNTNQTNVTNQHNIYNIRNSEWLWSTCTKNVRITYTRLKIYLVLGVCNGNEKSHSNSTCSLLVNPQVLWFC